MKHQLQHINKRQRHQLNQKFKSKNKYKFNKSEDILLQQVLEGLQEVNAKVNWKQVEAEFNNRLQNGKPRKVLELFKRYNELKEPKEVSWTDEQNKLLESLVLKYGDKNWFQISMNYDTKNSYQCLMQYKKLESSVLKPSDIPNSIQNSDLEQVDNPYIVKKGKWSLIEDIQLMISLKVFGAKNWAMIAK